MRKNFLFGTIGLTRGSVKQRYAVTHPTLRSMPATLMPDHPRESSSTFPPRAGFWIRGVAAVIDLAILVVPFCIFVSFAAAITGISNPFFNHRPGDPLNQTLRDLGPTFLALCICFFAAESWLYFAVSESSRRRATLGKRLLGLYVGDLGGRPVDFWQASLRFCTGRLLVHVPVLGGYYFLVDCLCAGLT